jgi:hypothetical protein
MFTFMRRLTVTGSLSAAVAFTIAAAPGQAAPPSMMTRSTSLSQQRTQLLAALQRQRAELMTALQNAAMRLIALRQLPGTAARNTLMMALQRQEVALTSALQTVNAQIAALLR